MSSQEQQLILTLGRYLTNAGVLDDDAFIAPDGRVYTTDMLIEGQHFDLGYFPPQQLGWKLGAVNLSDIAAMGAEPLYMLVSLGLPKHWGNEQQCEFVEGLYAGLADLLHRYGGQIIGGDTVGADRVTLNMTAIGQLGKDQTAGRRKGAQPGDWIVSTGFSGLSVVGLQVLRSPERYKSEDYSRCVEAHLLPHPQLAAGQFLAAHYDRYALMDTSDGLADAALKIAVASRDNKNEGLQLCINAQLIPIHQEVRQFACQSGQPPLQLALYGGEDFQLLACVPVPQNDLQKQALNAAGFTRIGRVKALADAAPLSLLENEAGMPLEVLTADKTYQHF